MKKIIYLLFFLPLIGLGQTNSENFVKTTTYKVPYFGSNILYTLDENDQTIILPPINSENKIIQITYFDGLGRPKQQIAVGQSNIGSNIITPIVYDNFGRQIKEYLPYATSTNNLDFIPMGTALTDQASFSLYEGQVAYSEKLIEGSPLNRVLKQAAPGNDWAMVNNHVIRFDYQTNTTADAVKLFTFNLTWNASKGLYDIPSTLTPTNYASFQLYKTITKDENWVSGTDNTTEEFKDKEGRVVLKRTYNLGEKYDTYYVYDQYGNLTFVLPPLVNATTTITETQLNLLCYQYKYDSRNRLVEKKLPGKQWEFIVYDKLDRVVATGPALSPFSNLGGNGWMITKYDAFNRVVYTGWMPTTFSTTSRSTLQSQFNNATTNFNETKIATTTNTTVNGIAFRYTNVALPTTDYHVLTVNYYDDYNFPDAPVIPTSIEDEPVFYTTTIKPKGLPTGNYVRVLETSTMYKKETSYMLYDKKARVIRSHTKTHLGGYTQLDSKYDFSKLLYTVTKHRQTATSIEMRIDEAFTYSPQDRLLTHTHRINLGVVEQLSHNIYDDLGQLITKKVGGTAASGPLQVVDYAYNIRGWLTDINNTNTSMAETNDLFSFKIGYTNFDTPPAEGVQELYNGNIAETYWRSASDNVVRKYGYIYDPLNRLNNAIYQKPTQESAGITNSYNESIAYDKNGNITYLERFGELDDEVLQIKIDELHYHYNGNQLEKVLDLTNNPNGFKDDSNGTDDAESDYAYDLNGNLLYDQNKKIIKIIYNHLNLPTKIVFLETGTIEYIYNAIGQKLFKRVTTPQETITTDYVGGFQYVNGNLKFFPTAEGYVMNGNYVYNYMDHLGNIRLSYTKNPQTGDLKILEENHYYPFGLKHKSYNMNKEEYQNSLGIEEIIAIPLGKQPQYKYKYNGKEYQDELGLNIYTYGFRDYDPAIGRWNVIDPLAEKSRRWSPYNYCLDNPVRFVDPDGREVINIEGGVRFTGNDAKLAFNAIKKEIDETGGVKVHLVSESVTPNIYKHTLNSFRKGKPNVLHYDSNKENQAQRRKEAMKGYPSRGAEGLQRDEYPYASTAEGGTGADVAYVPSKENSSQGGSLGALYSTLKSGDSFLVLPVPKDKEPDAIPEPSPSPVPSSPSPFMRKMSEATGLTGTALLIYVIVSEGSRLFPPRNLVPIP